MKDCIAIPIDLSSSPRIGRVPGDTESEINAFIELIVFTAKGSFSADPDFGFEFWNHEFSNINTLEFNDSFGGLSQGASMNAVARRQCEESLRKSILSYEPRLKNPEVKVILEKNETKKKKIIGVKLEGKEKTIMPKYEMRVVVTGILDEGIGMGRRYEKVIDFLVEPTARKK